MTQTALDKALVVLQREDPSFKVCVLYWLSNVKSLYDCIIMDYPSSYKHTMSSFVSCEW